MAAWKSLLVLCCVVLASLVPGCIGQGESKEQIFARLAKDMQDNPRDASARYLMAQFLMMYRGMESGVELLMSSFDANQVDTALGMQNPVQGFIASNFLTRYHQEWHNHEAKNFFANMAYFLSRQMSGEMDIAEMCTQVHLATMLNSYPLTNEEVDESAAHMEEWSKKLLDLFDKKHPNAQLNNEFMSQNVLGFAGDPYVHCMLTLFPLSFMYRADVAKLANLNFEVGARVWPKLLHTAEHVRKYEEEQKLASRDTNGGLPSQKCIDGKIKLGIVSATLSRGHSVAEDFGGVIQRLDRNVFDVTFVYIHEKSNPGDEDDFVTANPDDKLIHYQKLDGTDERDGAWPRRIGKDIEELKFDMIFYPELTMSSIVRRLGMERLAPVQINSHGHPVTSGHPREIVQHFVSWAEAELPLEQSQTHYTEELQLIPKGKIHQYYTPRVETGPKGKRISRMTQMPFDHYTRKDYPEFSDAIQNSTPEDDDIHLYVCMQKPFKLFPEFDELVCGILQKDPMGHAVLHKEDMRDNTGIFEKRMRAAGCDMDRVHFLPTQPPHKLLALYDTASVIIDSYPAGGCTTTREALELGKAVVTWPARLLGGRWTLGLYHTIGLDEDARNRLVADSKEDYISKAVELGTNRSLRKSVESSILEAVPTLFGRYEAVEEWEKILKRVSPVKQCSDGSVGERDEL